MEVLGVLVFFGTRYFIRFFFTVKQETAAIVERFGKFQSVRQSGLHLKIPFVDQIAKKNES